MIEYQHPTRIDRWREQIGDRPVSDTRRPRGAMGYLTRAKQYCGLVEIERLTLVVLYDEHHRGGGKALRLAGFSGRRVPWGAEWGRLSVEQGSSRTSSCSRFPGLRGGE